VFAPLEASKWWDEVAQRILASARCPRPEGTTTMRAFAVFVASPARCQRRCDLPAPSAGERLLRRFLPVGRCRAFPWRHTGGKRELCTKSAGERLRGSDYQQPRRKGAFGGVSNCGTAESVSAVDAGPVARPEDALTTEVDVSGGVGFDRQSYSCRSQSPRDEIAISVAHPQETVTPDPSCA
jgi:hypothetical protein